MEKMQKVKELFNELSENEKINYWNEWADTNKYYDYKIWTLDGYTLEAFFNSIEDFAKSVSDSDHFNYNDRYFKIGDIYNDITTGNYWEDLAEPDDYFYEWLLYNYEDDFLDDNEEEA